MNGSKSEHELALAEDGDQLQNIPVTSECVAHPLTHLVVHSTTIARVPALCPGSGLDTRSASTLFEFLGTGSSYVLGIFKAIPFEMQPKL